MMKLFHSELDYWMNEYPSLTKEEVRDILELDVDYSLTDRQWLDYYDENVDDISDEIFDKVDEEFGYSGIWEQDPIELPEDYFIRLAQLHKATNG